MNKIDGYENQNRKEGKKIEEKRVKANAKENAPRHTDKDKPTWLKYAIKHFDPSICYWTISS